MRSRSLITTVVVIASFVVGCGDGGKNDAASSSTRPTTTTASRAELSAMLLTADDIGQGTGRWTVRPLDADGLALQPCAAEVGPVTTARLTAEVGMDAGRADGNAALQERLIVGDPQQLDEDLAEYRDVLGSCLGPTSTSAGSAPAFEPLAIPDLGDQRWAVTGPTPGWPSGSRTSSAYVRIGGSAVNLVVSEQPVTTGAPLLTTDEEFVRLLQAAVDKVEG